jgi:hypothetical protein
MSRVKSDTPTNQQASGLFDDKTYRPGQYRWWGTLSARDREIYQRCSGPRIIIPFLWPERWYRGACENQPLMYADDGAKRSYFCVQCWRADQIYQMLRAAGEEIRDRGRVHDA